ncbi:hypothetical protein XENOCAPTIV_020852 [Xenoophorus captivus]|uniref:Uncharacterized protein n=1 Tax=Xenoophorus captivus TaxID=1517983 RepID=A0ABV0S8S3_9TELE
MTADLHLCPASFNLIRKLRKILKYKYNPAPCLQKTSILKIESICVYTHSPEKIPSKQGAAFSSTQTGKLIRVDVRRRHVRRMARKFVS